MKIIAAVAHAPHMPGRVDSLRRMMLQLPESAHWLNYVIDDKAPPCVWSEKQWLSAMNTEGCTHGLFLNDDLILCDEFQEVVAKVIAARPSDILSLYCSDPNAKKLLGRWYSSRDGLIGNAYVIPIEVLADFLRFRREDLREGMTSQLSEDLQINLYAMATGRLIWHTRPSLIEHDVSIPSAFGNESNPARTSAVPPWSDMKNLDWTPKKGYHLGRFFDGNIRLLLAAIKPEAQLRYGCFEKYFAYHRDYVARVRLDFGRPAVLSTASEWCDPNDLPATHYQRRLCLGRYEWACSRIRPGSIVANAACGANYGTPMLLKAGAHRVVGVDNGKEQKELNEKRNYGEFCLADIESLQFSGFDTLVSIETLEHLREPYEFLKRLSRDVKDLIFTTPVVPTKHLNPHHLHDFTEEQLRGWLAELGWTIADAQYQDDPGWQGGTEKMCIMIHAVRK